MISIESGGKLHEFGWTEICVYRRNNLLYLVFHIIHDRKSILLTLILCVPDTTISPPGQTIVSNRTLDAETKPTRRHLVVDDDDMTFVAFAFGVDRFSL